VSEGAFLLGDHKVKTLFISILVVPLVVACAARPFVKPDGTVASEREVKECQYEATKASAGATNVGFGTGPTMRAAIVLQQCMDLKGYKVQ
jgi:hypothetical protein